MTNNEEEHERMKQELIQTIEPMSETQIRLVLSFVKNMFNL